MNYHSKKDVDKAIRELIELGWTWKEKKGGGHVVGYLLCNHDTDGHHRSKGCTIRVFGSPKNASNHANKIRQQARNLTC